VAYDPEKHHRRSIRLEGYDYRCEGAYFITICTRDRACVFGTVADDAVKLSQRGMIAEACWHDIPNHRPYVSLDKLIVMPNHIHGILWIDAHGDAQRATQVSPLQHPRLLPESLGAIVGAYKAAVTRNINKIRPGAAADLWQPNYFEHIIRDQRGLVELRDYIVLNPQRWARDLENPAGDGTDDFEAFIRALESNARLKEGDTNVAPTNEAADA
jgi:REP element-mobilizing transposase RayT